MTFILEKKIKVLRFSVTEAAEVCDLLVGNSSGNGLFWAIIPKYNGINCS